MLGRQVLGLVAAALLMVLPAQSAGCEGLVAGPRGTVSAVPDGDTVLLADGTAIRLIGMQAPKLPLGRAGFDAWPKAEEARQALEALAMGAEVELRHGGEKRDRHGRALGQLFLADGTWVQREMLSRGYGRVYSFPDNRACLAELLAAETHARTMRLGIWQDSYYSVRAADRPADIAGRSGHYEIVEGRVLLAASASGRIYLNFGRYWKEDFTAVIEGRAQKLFAAAAFDPLRLEGALVRIRGWVDDRDGPRIEVTHPEQIEVLAVK